VALAADRVVVLGASAGGPLALGDVLAVLPPDLDAAVVVVLHLLADHPSLLAQVLARRTDLPVTQACESDVLEPGHVYVAPPDAHLAFDADRRVHLESTPPVRFHRPSIDRTFEAAADAFGDAAIAVVLTGTGSDGALGAARVHERGGVVVAQESPEFPGMPQAAIDTGIVDRVLPLASIGPTIVELAGVAV
jgi:two-component system chemotaxis response regulator CheB